jgi:hypothetical protein
MPIPAPRWVLAYYLAPIFCGTNHHMTSDWHAGIVQSSVVHLAFSAAFLLHFFENREKVFTAQVITNIGTGHFTSVHTIIVKEVEKFIWEVK